jgi:chloramphenicol 3-O-phosphotransferase
LRAGSSEAPLSIMEARLAGQIIIVSGTSGAGKSTTCELLAARSDDFWLLYGIDHFLSRTFPARFGHHGSRAREGYYSHPVDPGDPDGTLRWSFGEKGWRAIRAFHEWVAAASREGCNIVVDHLMMTDPPVLQDCIWRLEGLPVLFVSLKPPSAVLSERIAGRTIGAKAPAAQIFGDNGIRRTAEMLNRLSPWFCEVVYANDCSDLEIDTAEHHPGEVCDLIERRLAEGPGVAFSRLRERWPLVKSTTAIIE